MSGEAQGWVWKHGLKDPITRYVHLAIGDVVNDMHDNEFWMSVEALASKTCLCEKTVRTALKDLREGGFLEVVSAEPGQTVKYRFLFPTPVRDTEGVGSTYRGTPVGDTGGGRYLLPTIHNMNTSENSSELKPSPGGRKNGHPYPPDFEAFWALYPRKTEKGDALKAWKAINGTRPSLEVLSVALGWQRRKPGWVKDGGEFIPYPAKWLRARGWEDEQQEVQTACTMRKTAANSSAIESWLSDKKEEMNETGGFGEVREIADDSRRYIR